MSRWDHNEAMGRPWIIELKPDRPGGGYRLKGSSGDFIRIYGSKADVDLIIEAVNSIDKLAKAREALEWYATEYLKTDEELNADISEIDECYETGNIAREALKGSE